MALMYGKVVATVIEVRGDSADAGSEPDVIGATSVKVNFQPRYTSFVSSLTRRIVNVKPIVCSVDAAGNLLDPQGAVGIWLLVGEYTVSFTNSHHPNITIMVTEAHTNLAPLNLGDSVPYVPPSGTTVTTVILPGGAAEGQIVGWVGGQLAWVDPTLGTENGGTGGGVELVSGVVDLDGTGSPVREFYTTAAATIEGVAFAAGTAVVFRRTLAGVWGYIVVDPWTDISGTTTTTTTAAATTTTTTAAATTTTTTAAATTTTTTTAATTTTTTTAATTTTTTTSAATTTTTTTEFVPPTTLLEAMVNFGAQVYWPLTETSGTSAIDYSGNNRNGTLVGTANTDYVLAGDSGYLKFLNSTGGVWKADDDYFTPGSEGMTLFFLVKGNPQGSNRQIANKSGEWRYLHHYESFTGGYTASNGSSWAASASSGNVSSQGSWSKVAITSPAPAAGAYPTYYVNNTTPRQTDLLSQASPGTNSTLAFILGQGLVGSIGEFAYFRRQLTTQEIGYLMSLSSV